VGRGEHLSEPPQRLLRIYTQISRLEELLSRSSEILVRSGVLPGEVSQVLDRRRVSSARTRSILEVVFEAQDRAAQSLDRTWRSLERIRANLEVIPVILVTTGGG